VKNWAGNQAYRAARLLEPGSLDELQEIVRAGRSLRVLGSRHSFNDIADTTGDHVSLSAMPRIYQLDRGARTVRVDGAVRYGELAVQLHADGFALHNLASLPHISVAGACATATHGSGDRSGNLATAVVAVDVVTASGELVRFGRDIDSELFGGAVVALGALGVVTSLTLAVEPTFEMRQDLYENVSLAQVAGHFDEITSLADSVSLFTEWHGPGFEQLWLKRRVGRSPSTERPFAPPPTIFGASRATGKIHPIRRMPADALTEQLGVPGPWHERLPHFRMDHTPSAGAELQTEWLLPRGSAVDALIALQGLRSVIEPLVQVSEVRTVAADALWMSTAYGRASVAIHFTWQPDWEAVRQVVPRIEAALAPFGPRPHWGKLFAMAPDMVRAAYERRPSFVALAERLDPEGKFHNEFLERYVFGGR
jgi:xylitol oxidase